jgi:penicillin-binding protein 2
MKDRFQRIREIRSLPSTALRIYFFAFIILTAMGALAAKLWNEQMIEGKKWKDKVGKEGEVTVRIPSVRGEIRDRNGWPLVENQPSYGVDFYLPEMVQGMKDTIKQRNQEKLQEAQREGKHFSKK